MQKAPQNPLVSCLASQVSYELITTSEAAEQEQTLGNMDHAIATENFEAFDAAPSRFNQAIDGDFRR